MVANDISLNESRAKMWRTASRLRTALDNGDTRSIHTSSFGVTAWIRFYLLDHLGDSTLEQLRTTVNQIDDVSVVVVLLALAKCEAVACSGRGFTEAIMDNIVSETLRPYVFGYWEFSATEVPQTAESTIQFIDHDMAALGFAEFIGEDVFQLIRKRLMVRTVRDVNECVSAARKGQRELALLACELITRRYGHVALVNDFVTRHRGEFKRVFQRFRLSRARSV